MAAATMSSSALSAAVRVAGAHVQADAAGRVSTRSAATSRLSSSTTSFRGERIESLAALPQVQRVARLVAQARAPSASVLESAVNDAVRAVAGEEAMKRWRPAASILAANALMALPAHAEVGKIFDFNLTLPIMAIQFILLMITLDNIWFKPVSKIMDDRDAKVRSQLAGVQDNTKELEAYETEGEQIIRAARIEIASALAAMKKETQAELDAKMQLSRERIEKEMAEAIASLEAQREETMKNLDKQVQQLSEEIVSKVIPIKI